MSKIEWTEKTWNPVVGCSIVSPGCTNCYAMKMASRLAVMLPADRRGPGLLPNQYADTTKVANGKPVWTGRLNRAPDHILLEPLRRQKPTMWFVNSMSDLFHENVPDEWIDRVFAVMALCPQHTFQVLTKRSARMRSYLSMARAHPVGLTAMEMAFVDRAANPRSQVGAGVVLQGDIVHLKTWPLPNVWLGVSTEDQKRADERIPDLLATPAAVRFISAEPLLRAVNLKQISIKPGWVVDALTGRNDDMHRPCPDKPRLDWVIVGGESGPGARPMHPDWARDIRDQCEAAGVPFFFKQWGAWKPICEMPGDESDLLYRSNRSAKPHESQENIDDLYGRTCTVTTGSVRFDGRLFKTGELGGFESIDGHYAMQVFNVGKGKAGRLLNGRTHDGMPALASAERQADEVPA